MICVVYSTPDTGYVIVHSIDVIVQQIGYNVADQRGRMPLSIAIQRRRVRLLVWIRVVVSMQPQCSPVTLALHAVE